MFAFSFHLCRHCLCGRDGLGGRRLTQPGPGHAPRRVMTQPAVTPPPPPHHPSYPRKGQHTLAIFRNACTLRSYGLLHSVVRSKGNVVKSPIYTLLHYYHHVRFLPSGSDLEVIVMHFSKTPSLSNKWKRYDNMAMESFFSINMRDWIYRSEPRVLECWWVALTYFPEGKGILGIPIGTKTCLIMNILKKDQ